MTFPYATAVWSKALAGVARAEDVSRVLASRAIEECCLELSKKYGIPYVEMVSACKEDVLRRLELETAAGSGCRGRCVDGGGCKILPVPGTTYCAMHQAQGERAESRKRQREAFEIQRQQRRRHDVAQTTTLQYYTRDDAPIRIRCNT